jgi:hypothetical protein
MNTGWVQLLPNIATVQRCQIMHIPDGKNCFERQQPFRKFTVSIHIRWAELFPNTSAVSLGVTHTTYTLEQKCFQKQQHFGE